MKNEDEAIISASNSTSQQPAAASNSSRRGAERTLQKTSWISNDTSAAIGTLEELTDSMHGGFNQFEGKKTDYSDELYTTKLNMDKVSRE